MRPLRKRRHSDRPARRSWGRSGGLLGLVGVGALALGVLALGACSLDGLLKSNELPPNVTDPALMESPDGARAAYYSALQQLHVAFGAVGASGSDLSFLKATGYLSDELSGDPAWMSYPQVDFRQLVQAQTDPLFAGLNNLRQRTGQAIGLVSDFLSDEPALRAHLYAVEGYADVMLAELYCSGIPLSTVDYHGDYTLRPGSTTTEVFRHAAALFDTALALAGTTDSARILNLSRVGHGRALLGLGEYAAAAAAVTAVSDTFRYTALYNGSDSARGPGWSGTALNSWGRTGVQDREGTNGLDYVSSGDPRVPTMLYTNNFYYPAKYHPDGQDTVVLASGVEARLIEAEAALQQGDGAWLDKLNALRTDGTQDGSGTYNPGTGGVAGLAPLDDPDPSAAPGSTPSRVDLLFRERAFWLFLTGHRQGDMRRLVRQYHRPQSQVYPVGVHARTGEVYGSYIDLPIPMDEQTLNPLFSGCFSRD